MIILDQTVDINCKILT